MPKAIPQYASLPSIYAKPTLYVEERFCRCDCAWCKTPQFWFRVQASGVDSNKWIPQCHLNEYEQTCKRALQCAGTWCLTDGTEKIDRKQYQQQPMQPKNADDTNYNLYSAKRKLFDAYIREWNKDKQASRGIAPPHLVFMKKELDLLTYPSFFRSRVSQASVVNLDFIPWSAVSCVAESCNPGQQFSTRLLILLRGISRCYL